MPTSSEVLHALPLPALVVGGDRRIADQNGAASDLFRGDLTGRHLATAIRQPALLDAVEAVIEGTTSTTARYLVTTHGREQIFDVHMAALESDHSVLMAFVDTAPQEEAGQMRSDFVANVSHELRTPLTALTGFIETLRGPARDDAAARARFLDIMAEEAGRMNRLVTDLLSLSRVEDMARMRPTDLVDLDQVIAMVATTLGPAAADRQVEMVIQPCNEQPALVTGDRDQLTQVVTNLTENAIKYGRKGGIVRITTRALEQVPTFKGPGVEVSVEDDGDGIDPKHLGRLTERFYRVDTHRSREMGGTGLGLAIVKHIVNRHRGRLRIDSAMGQGSTFTVSLPAAAAG